MWQDIVIGIANILLGYAIVPQIIHNFKNKHNDVTFQTSFIATIGIYVLMFTFITLRLTFSAVVSGINATLWLIILIQGFLYKRKNQK